MRLRSTASLGVLHPQLVQRPAQHQPQPHVGFAAVLPRRAINAGDLPLSMTFDTNRKGSSQATSVRTTTTAHSTRSPPGQPVLSTFPLPDPSAGLDVEEVIALARDTRAALHAANRGMRYLYWKDGPERRLTLLCGPPEDSAGTWAAGAAALGDPAP
jgi:hypothetical protein